MIHWKCTNCNEDLETDNENSGRKAQCHKCNTEQVVPLPNFLPRIGCPNCEHELSLTEESAGLLVKCPKCGTMVRAPEIPGAPSKGCSFTAMIALATGIGVLWLVGSRLLAGGW